jgi:hypothetical protein
VPLIVTDGVDLDTRGPLTSVELLGRHRVKSQLWIHHQIKHSQFEVFEEAEAGQHFMFIENPEKFNRTIIKYLG